VCDGAKPADVQGCQNPNCNPALKPATSQSCNPQACPPFIVNTNTLSFGGGGGSAWTHKGVLWSNGVLSVSTSYSNPALKPSVASTGVSNIPYGGCSTGGLGGTIISNGASFSTVVTYCRNGNSVSISHLATIDGAPGPGMNHGVLQL